MINDIETGIFINKYKKFFYFNNNEVNDFPSHKDLILNNFYIDEKEYIYDKIFNLIEYIVKKDIVMDLY